MFIATKKKQLTAYLWNFKAFGRGPIRFIIIIIDFISPVFVCLRAAVSFKLVDCRHSFLTALACELKLYDF